MRKEAARGRRVLVPEENRLQVRVWFKSRTRAEVRNPEEVSREEKKRPWLGGHAWLGVPQAAIDSSPVAAPPSQNEPGR